MAPSLKKVPSRQETRYLQTIFRRSYNLNSVIQDVESPINGFLHHFSRDEPLFSWKYICSGITEMTAV